MRSEQIDFFKSCAASLNFSLAAKYHFVSVSTLSSSISALEDEIGLKLFERGYHGNQLTDAGRAFFEITMNTTIEYEHFFRKWTGIDEETIVIGCKPYNRSFERLINAYFNLSAASHFSKLKVELIPDDKLFRCLDDRIINIAICEKDVCEDCYSIPFTSAGSENLVFVSKYPFNEKIVSILSKLSASL